jgi:hypothetical protein
MKRRLLFSRGVTTVGVALAFFATPAHAQNGYTAGPVTVVMGSVTKTADPGSTVPDPVVGTDTASVSSETVIGVNGRSAGFIQGKFERRYTVVGMPAVRYEATLTHFASASAGAAAGPPPFNWANADAAGRSDGPPGTRAWRVSSSPPGTTEGTGSPPPWMNTYPVLPAPGTSLVVTASCIRSGGVVA